MIIMYVCHGHISVTLQTETDSQKTRRVVSTAPIVTDTEPSRIDSAAATSPPTASDMWSTAQTSPKTLAPALADPEPEAAPTTDGATPQATPTSSGGPTWTVGGAFTAQDTTNERGEFGLAVSETSRATTTTDEAPPVRWRGAAASEEEKRAQSWEVVVDMLHRLNENESDLANIDSKALCKMQQELQKVCEGITRFMKLSSTLVDDEGI